MLNKNDEKEEKIKKADANIKGVPSVIGDEIIISIDGVDYKAKHREFKSGRKGYGLYGLCKIRGYPHRLSINLIEVGS